MSLSKPIGPFLATFLVIILSLGCGEAPGVKAQNKPQVKPEFVVKKSAKKPVLTATTISILTEEKVPIYSNAELLVTTDAKFIKVKVQKSLFDVVKVYEVVHSKVNERKFVFTGPPGKFVATVTTFDPEDGIAEESAVITLGAPGPDPDPGPEPGPDPGPDPGPTPPDDVIVPGPFRLLVIEETNDRGKSDNSIVITFDPEIREYLNSKTFKDSNSTPEYRVLDDDLTDEQIALENDNFEEIYKKKTWKSTPWFIISNGKQGTEGPLPNVMSGSKLNYDESKKALMTILKKYGG